jgi:hypothetical protein
VQLRMYWRLLKGVGVGLQEGGQETPLVVVCWQAVMQLRCYKVMM